MNLMGIALDKDSRYSVKYVIEIITRKLGSWLTPRKRAEKTILNADLRRLAEQCIKVD
jgi:hypothetical protein